MSSNTEKRKVSTDALETLGSTIDESCGRDAIHLAVEPIMASEMLMPGAHVGILDGKATSKAEKKLGIVDPFLTEPIFEGERFWLIVYPRQITSLRHVWEHPDFTPEAKAQSFKNQKTEQSKQWIRNFAADCIECEYEELMAGAVDYAQSGDYMSMGDNEAYSGHEDKMPEFWKHFQQVTGIDPGDKAEDSFFSCSC